MRTGMLGMLACLWGTLVFAVGFHVNFPDEAVLERIRWELK